MPPEDDD